MEHLDEHDNLKFIDSNDKKPSSHTPKNNISLSMLTPNSNRKNSDFLVNNMRMNDLQKLVKNKNVVVLGFCGAQSSGKSLIAYYFRKHLINSVYISEKDYFIPSKEKRKKTTDEKIGSIGLNIEEDYPLERKERLTEVNMYKNFDFEKLCKDVQSLQKGKSINLQYYDKNENST